MSGNRRAVQQELDEWKRALPVPTGSRKAVAAKQLRDGIREFTFGFRDWLEGTMLPRGMTLAQLRMLFAVKYESEGSSARIARLCQVTPQTMQAMLQRAVREGWLVRQPARHNARILVSTLTPKGDALLQEAIAATTAFELEVWRDASVADLQTMTSRFSKAVQRIRKADRAPAITPARKKRPRSAAKL